jgi:hypothetical protein
MVEIDRRKAALIAELEISRGEIRRSMRACEENLNLVSVLRRNVRGNLKFWLPGAALGGWVVSKLVRLQLRRPRSVREVRSASASDAGRSGGWLVGLLKMAVDLLRPTLLAMATEWLARKVSEFTPAQGGSSSAEPRASEGERQAHTRNGMF